MNGTTSRFAAIQSTNVVSFGFPYAGEQHARILVRKHARFGNDIIFSVERGQLQCDVYTCPVTVRFDDGKPQRLSGATSADHDSTTTFLPGFDRLVASMAKAKIMRVEATFYQQGAHVFEFDVSGLDTKRLTGSKG